MIRCRGELHYLKGNEVSGGAETPCETNRSKAKSRSMPSCALHIRSGWCAGAAAAVLTGAIILMLGLSVAPNLHERLHPTRASLHECAVTLIASSSCHHTAAVTLLIAPATVAQRPK